MVWVAYDLLLTAFMMICREATQLLQRALEKILHV